MKISVSTLNKMMSRKSIDEIAKTQGQSAEDAVIDVLLASEGRAIVSLEVLSEQNVMKAIQHPFSIVSSNGVGYAKEHAAEGDLVHPRNFGTFPKVFAEYVREKKAISWEEAVHKMTGKPAVKFSMKDRGFLREKHRADIVVFDPETIADRATMEDPYQYPDGIRFVLVNGVISVEGGSWNGARQGEVIRKKSGFSLW
jgi:N-acyl-D-amino-acid deacylase